MKRLPSSCYKQDIAIAREIKDNQSEGIHFGNLVGSAFRHIGQHGKACFLSFQERAIAIAREIKDRETEGIYVLVLTLGEHDMITLVSMKRLYHTTNSLLLLSRSSSLGMTLGRIGHVLHLMTPLDRMLH